MEEEDEDDLRKDATKLVTVLDHEKHQESSKRRWLGRDWPEKRIRVLDSFVSEYEKCLAESFLRTAQGNSYTSLHELVKGGMDALSSEDPPPVALEDLDSMSDAEVLEAFPRLTKTLQFTTLRSIYYALFGESKKPKSRLWIEGAVVQKFGLLLGESRHEELQKVVTVLRDCSASPSKKTRARFDAKTLVMPQLPESCNFQQAAEIALSTLDDLSGRCLRAVLDFMRERDFQVKDLYLCTRDSRKRILKQVNGRVKAFMKEPEALNYYLDRPLRVISLHANELQGDDGGLSKFLTQLTPEAEAMHGRLLSAMRQLHKLDFEDLEQVYQTLTRSEKKSYGTRHPRVYYESVRGILQEALYRCTPQQLPEFVSKALDMIAAAKPPVLIVLNQVQNKVKLEEAETEALLNVSSSLQQICWEWIGGSSDAPVFEDVTTEGDTQEAASEESEDEEDYFMNYSFAQMTNEQGGQEAEESLSLMEQDVEKLDDVNKDVTAVADESAALAYAVIGRAMEQRVQGALKPAARKYLRAYTSGEAETESPSDSGDTNLLLRVLKSIPSLPPRVLEKVALRFEELDS